MIERGHWRQFPILEKTKQRLSLSVLSTKNAQSVREMFLQIGAEM